MDNKYVLGLDIGISSCGYGVIDLETGKFVDYGVRLFKEGTAEDNGKRRDARSRRRFDFKTSYSNYGHAKIVEGKRYNVK